MPCRAWTLPGRWTGLTCTPSADDRRQLYELGWNSTEDGNFAFDAGTGLLVDANPAAEKLMGYLRGEMLGMHVTMLHPEAERERVIPEFWKAAQEPSRHTGFHILRKDGRCVPVLITSSKSVQFGSSSNLICVFRDITDQLETEHRLSTQNWALSAYAGAALALGRANTSGSLLQEICEAITRQSAYVLAWVGIAEDCQERRIRVTAAAGSAVGYLDGLHLSWSESEPEGLGPTGICIRTNELQIMADAETVESFLPWRERAALRGIRSTISIPFSFEDRQCGALIVCAAYANAFEPVAIEVFQHLAEQIGHGLHAIGQEQMLHAERLQLAKAERQLTEALSAMVAPIVTAMEMRDPYTAGHQTRVADIACAIGKEIGWPEGRLQGLRVASLVHDIGKISIPAEVLTKPTRLTPAEREMINGHAETGYTILKDIPFAWPIAEIVRQHHEKLNGSGYPFGLLSEAILPEAKVLAVADVVEAMSSFRPYRPAIPLETVLAEVEKEAADGLLDPNVVAVCVSLFREKHLVLPGFTQR